MDDFLTRRFSILFLPGLEPVEALPFEAESISIAVDYVSKRHEYNQRGMLRTFVFIILLGPLGRLC